MGTLRPACCEIKYPSWNNENIFYLPYLFIFLYLFTYFFLFGELSVFFTSQLLIISSVSKQATLTPKSLPNFWIFSFLQLITRNYMYSISSTFFVPPILLRPFWQNLTSTYLLRPKLYFDIYFSTNRKSRFVKRSKYRGRIKVLVVVKFRSK